MLSRSACASIASLKRSSSSCAPAELRRRLRTRWCLCNTVRGWKWGCQQKSSVKGQVGSPSSRPNMSHASSGCDPVEPRRWLRCLWGTVRRRGSTTSRTCCPDLTRRLPPSPPTCAAGPGAFGVRHAGRWRTSANQVFLPKLKAWLEPRLVFVAEQRRRLRKAGIMVLAFRKAAMVNRFPK